MIHNRVVLSFYAVAFYIFNLMVVRRSYDLRYENGDFKVESDSMGAAIGMYTILWILGIPILTIVLFAISRTRTDELTLFSVNGSKPILTGLIALVFVFLVSWDFFFVVEEIRRFDVIVMVYAILEIHLLLCLRVVITFLGRKI